MKRKMLLCLYIVILLATFPVMASCSCISKTKTTTTTSTTQTSTTTLITTSSTAPTTSTSGPVPTGVSQARSASLDILVQNGRFSTEQIIVYAGVEVTLTLHNEDSRVIHNLSIYKNSDATSANAIFVGQSVNGPSTVTYRFQAPAKGIYYFRCDYFPTALNGLFISI